LIELTLKVALEEHHSECSSQAPLLNTPGTLRSYFEVELIGRWTWRPCYVVGGLIFFWPWATVACLVPADPPQDKASKLDWLGSLLMGISLFLLLFGFTSSQTESKGWRTPCTLIEREVMWLTSRCSCPNSLLRSIYDMLRTTTSTAHQGGRD
jgi:hypothetical protein